MSTDSWIALDFETATRDRTSACALGITVIENGTITASSAWLFQPPGNAYEYVNTRIHGIDEDDTAQAPTFAELYGELWPYLHQRKLVAHNASFDISVLRATIDHYGLPHPSARYACSCKMSKRAFPALPNHRLPTVCEHCEIPLRHHDAASDAYACARVALSCRDHVGTETLGDALSVLRLQLSTL